MACRMLVPQPGTEPKLSSESTESHLVDHREFPVIVFLIAIHSQKKKQC